MGEPCLRHCPQAGSCAIPHRSAFSIAETFKQVIHDFEERRPQAFSILNVSKDYNIPHRRAYDFFNLLNSLGICSSIERGSLRWIGIAELARTIKELYAQMEVMAFDQTMLLLFATGPSPTLGMLASRFICLFFYLGVDVLSMRQAAKLFHNRSSDIKSLERRMYLVLSFLEALGTVTHTAKTSEYQLMIERKDVVEYAMTRKRQFSADRFAASVESLLNRYDKRFLGHLYQRRGMEFSGAVCDQ
jgi:hypothetical protein